MRIDSSHRLKRWMGDGLWGALERLPDHRTAKGRRYSLASIVGLSLAAMLAGANDLLAIHRWGRRLTPKGLAALGITQGRAPVPRHLCESAWNKDPV